MATVLLVTILTATPRAQARQPSPDSYHTYRAAVATYKRTADIARAVVALQSWSAREFDEAVKATLASRSAADLEAASIFHLEIGVALAGISTASAAGHIRYGSELLDGWTATQLRLGRAAATDEQTFRSIWFGVAGSAFVAVKDFERAGPLLSKALAAWPASARALTLMGTAKELEASLYDPDDAPTLSRKETIKRERALRLSRAENNYREAIKIDPGYALAYIRLGRVLHLSGRLRDAHSALERGRQLATDPLARYLHALYLGALWQDEKQLTAARDSLEQAVAIAPSSQPAIVALAHLEVMAGRPDRAHAVVRGMSEAGPAAEPWWAFHDGGLDVSGLRRLRERANK